MGLKIKKNILTADWKVFVKLNKEKKIIHVQINVYAYKPFEWTDNFIEKLQIIIWFYDPRKNKE